MLISSDKTGMHQMGGSGTGPYAAEGDTLPTSADQLTSINTKPKTGRVFLFAVPTSWLSVADVRRGIKDTRVGRFVGGTFGHVRPGPKAVGSEAYALTWVRDDVARELGLIDDTNFPARVGAAWDAVGEASKAWVGADKAYWKKRRSAIGRREERDAARIALDDAETAAGAARRRLAQSYDVAEAAHNAVEAPRRNAWTGYGAPVSSRYARPARPSKPPRHRTPVRLPTMVGRSWHARRWRRRVRPWRPPNGPPGNGFRPPRSTSPPCGSVRRRPTGG
ncbi:hypothetical protein A3838_00015 [Streptomyces badius]|nr:hypothetical protein A3838_00015 [Streptomyces badius]